MIEEVNLPPVEASLLALGASPPNLLQNATLLTPSSSPRTFTLSSSNADIQKHAYAHRGEYHEPIYLFLQLCGSLAVEMI